MQLFNRCDMFIHYFKQDWWYLQINLRLEAHLRLFYYSIIILGLIPASIDDFIPNVIESLWLPICAAYLHYHHRPSVSFFVIVCLTDSLTAYISWRMICLDISRSFPIHSECWIGGEVGCSLLSTLPNLTTKCFPPTYRLIPTRESSLLHYDHKSKWRHL